MYDLLCNITCVCGMMLHKVSVYSDAPAQCCCGTYMQVLIEPEEIAHSSPLVYPNAIVSDDYIGRILEPVIVDIWWEVVE